MSKLTYITFICLLVLILIIRFYWLYQNRKTYHNGQLLQMTILLLSDIDNNSKNVSISIILPDAMPLQRASVIFSPDTAPHYGQTFTFSGTIKEKVLNNKRTVMTVYYPKVAIRTQWTDSFLYPLYLLRQRIMDVYQMSLSDIDSALLLGIVFGIKKNMSAIFSQDLQATGLTHVIAASGMNVTMVAGFLFRFFGRFFKRQVAIGLSSVGLLFYAVFAGLQASILRATIMGICAFSAQLFGRQYNGVYILFLCGWAMLMMSPQLLFDIGFQLSFLSTVGIIILHPMIQSKYTITEDLATTISAQVATLPILMNTFGQYSLLSVVVNGLVLWTIPPLMMIGSLGAFLGLVVPILGKLVLYLAIPFLWFFESIVVFFASTTALIKVSINSPILLIGYYMILIAVVWGMYKRKTGNKLKSS